MAITLHIQIRGDTAENWESKNPVLLNREIGYDRTNNRLKVGNGLDGWTSLPYVAPDVINDLITGGNLGALSAEQGKILKELIDATAEDVMDSKLDADKVTHETWVFTLEDESTVDKEVVLWSS